MLNAHPSPAMEDGTQFATAAGADAQLATTQPSPSRGKNYTDYAKDAAVRVHVHDGTPLLQQTSESPDYESLPPSYQDAGTSGVDGPRWRRPSVS